MKKFKSLLSVVLIMSVVLCGFCGCSDKKETSGKEVITVWTTSSSSKKFMDKQVEEFNNTVGKKYGFKIDYQVKEGSSFNQSLDIAFKTEQAPDMITHTWDIQKLVENDNILAYEDIVGGNEYIEKYKDILVENIDTYNGKTYSVPYSAGTQGLLYNKDMFKAAGIVDENGEAKPPVTFEEMREVAKKLTNASKMEYGIIFPIKWDGWYGSDMMSVMMSSCGHQGYDPVTGEYDYSALEPILECYIGMKEDGSVFPGAEGIDNDTARAKFAAGGVAMKFGFSFDAAVLNDQFPAEIDWGVAPYPVIDENEKYGQRMDYGHSFLITKSAKEHASDENIMRVVEFFTGDELAIESYKEGTEMPFNYDLVADIDINSIKKTGWKEFAELVSISALYPNEPKVDLAGKRNIATIVKEDVWSGKISPAEAVKEFEKLMTEGRDKYYSTYTSEKADSFINKDWNIKR